MRAAPPSPKRVEGHYRGRFDQVDQLVFVLIHHHQPVLAGGNHRAVVHGVGRQGQFRDGKQGD
jgi:hypothetical protein